MKKNKRSKSCKERKKHGREMLRRVKCGVERIWWGDRELVEKDEAQG